MDLTTRCPQCGATFSASLEQLQLRKGYIRCPNCAHIFDGFDAVVPAGGQAPEPAPRPAAPRHASSAGPSAVRSGPAGALPHVVRQRAEANIHGSRNEPAFTISGEPRQAAGTHAEPVVSLPADDALPPQARASRAPYVGGPAVDDSEASDDEVREAGPGADDRRSFGVYVEPRTGETVPVPDADFLDPLPSRYRGFGFYFWGLLSVLGLALFLAQCLYVYRGQIAASLPAIRPLLERACVSLHCRVPYSRDIGEITIMNSSLQTSTSPQEGSGASATTPPAGGAMVLRVTLRNGLDKPQEWPTLVLDLLDFSGTVVVKKDLPPAAYLPPDLARRPFAAHSEVTAQVPITMNGVKVSGFQLAKYFS
jgi:predicted Zn finger-like uncharacterized protein